MGIAYVLFIAVCEVDGGGKKLFLCLAVLVLQTATVRRKCSGCEGSRMILLALLLTREEESGLLSESQVQPSPFCTCNLNGGKNYKF